MVSADTPLDKKEFPPFGGKEVQTSQFNSAEIVVLPLCYENAPSYGTGSLFGPYEILNASLQLELLDEETMVDWSTFRIHTLPPLVPSPDPTKAVRQMNRAARRVLENDKFLLSLGGDHAVSIGPILAASKVHPGMGVLQIDAHPDLRDSWNGSRYNHACVMRRVVADMGLPVIQVGIRTISREEAAFIKQKKLTPFFAHDIDPQSTRWMEKVTDMLPEKVYITLDVDGLDPSVIPGTGTPEPGGLTYRQVVALIEMIGKNRNVVAADITELAKIEGSQVSEYTAAKLATKIFIHCRKTAGAKFS